MGELLSFEGEKKMISDEELVAALRRGLDDSDVRRTFEDWTRQEEDKTGDPIASIEFNRRRGKIYVEAGYVAEGVEALEDSLDQAFHEHNEELVREITAEIDGVFAEHGKGE